jgi:RES domain-containing protein
LRAFRIADRRHPIFDGTGAALYGGRWNSPGEPVIYASASHACAMLERLAQTGTGRIPRSQVLVVIDIPDEVPIEHAAMEQVPLLPESRGFGDGWLAERRSVVLTVPSAVARHDRNVLIDPAHPDFARIRCGEPEPVRWDQRLFRQPP